MRNKISKDLFFHNEKSYVTMEAINANAMEWDLSS